MKVTISPITDLDGTVLKLGPESPHDMTVASVIVNCMLAPLEQGKPARGAEDIAERFDVAIKAHRLAVGEEMDLTSDQIVKIKTDMLRLYTPLVCGQMLNVLAGHPGMPERPAKTVN